MTTSLFAFGKKDTGNSSSSSNTASVQTSTSTSYGAYELASTAANYSYTTSYTDSFTKTYSFTNEVSASAGFDQAGFEAKVGFKAGNVVTLSKTFSLVCEPRKRYGYYTRPIYTNYSFTCDGKSVGSAKTLSGISGYILDNGTF